MTKNDSTKKILAMYHNARKKQKEYEEQLAFLEDSMVAAIKDWVPEVQANYRHLERTKAYWAGQGDAVNIILNQISDS